MSRFKSNLYTVERRVWRNHKLCWIQNDDFTLFSGHHKTKIKEEDLPEWYVFGRYYKLWGFLSTYDAKHGKPIPSNAIKCQENADPVTGHLPCWVPCDRTATGDKWFWDAYDRMGIVPDGTYEAIGPHFRANPYNLDADVLKPHGKDIVELDRSFEGIRTYLETHVIEGIVFWKDGHPRCKIKRKDFGFPWGR